MVPLYFPKKTITLPSFGSTCIKPNKQTNNITSPNIPNRNPPEIFKVNKKTDQTSKIKSKNSIKNPDNFSPPKVFSFDSIELIIRC